MPINNPKNIKNPFPEEKTVDEIYLAINIKNYDLLYQLLDRLPNFKNIFDIYILVVAELQKNKYTISQLLAISTLLYRLSNIKFATVELPEQFPNHSQASISNIYKNKQPNHYEYIDEKIKEIVKNLISHYNIDIIKRNNTGKFALKLQNILLSFIIEYTRPESSETLSVKSNFQNEKNLKKYAETHPEMMPRLLGPDPFK